MESESTRGIACIGLERPSKEVNIGHALRAAGCYEASMLAISGMRFKNICTDTQKTYRHIPLIHTEELKEVIPYRCRPVAVELVDRAKNIFDYTHPESAFYIFGPELGVVPDHILDYCEDVIYIPTKYCLNLGMCINTVLFDRAQKTYQKTKHAENRKKIFSLGE